MPVMKAAVVHSFGHPLQIEEVPIPEVTPGQVLVKVVASGVCHTDLHAADGDWPVKPTLPFIPGHEGVGFVAARCDACLGFHAKALVRLGATKAEVEEMLAVAVYMGGGPSLMYSANALAAFNEFADSAVGSVHSG